MRKESIYNREKVIAFTALICSIFFILIAFTQLISSRYISSPQNLLNKWIDDNAIDDPQMLSVTLESIETAIIYNQNNADYFMVLATYYEWNAKQFPIWNDRAVQLRKKALEQYRKALFVRPSWGYVWIKIAETKMRIFEFDEEAFKAFNRAILLSPHLSEVQEKAFFIGMSAWDLLPDESRELFKSLVETALVKFPQRLYLFELAAYQNWEDKLAPMIADDVLRGDFKYTVNRIRNDRYKP